MSIPKSKNIFTCKSMTYAMSAQNSACRWSDFRAGLANMYSIVALGSGSIPRLVR